MEAKLRLATEIVRRYHGDQVAAAERAWFQRTFSQRRTPEELPQREVVDRVPTALSLLRAVFPSKEKSNSELRRLITQGAVQMDGTPVRDPKAVVGVPCQRCCPASWWAPFPVPLGTDVVVRPRRRRHGCRRSRCPR
jgi:tyrosyl-tRNA synthetase